MSFGGMRKGFFTFVADKSSPHLQETSGDHGGTGTSHACTSSEYHDDLDQVEFQVLGEGDLVEECHVRWKKCKKYPGHERFVPVGKFNMKDLPERFQNKLVLDYIKAYADLTARLRVKTSHERPKDDPLAKGTSFTGTAYVSDVALLDTQCCCTECKSSQLKDRKRWSIVLSSATHCVYDETEAVNMEVDFLYDSSESLANNAVKTLCGATMVKAYRTHDVCAMKCLTHDDELGRYLLLRLHQAMQLVSKVESDPASLSSMASLNKAMVCISHPHGEPKQVTVGELRQHHDFVYENPEHALKVSKLEAATGARKHVFLYDTKTCPGSSGAVVINLDDLASNDVRDSLSAWCTHRGSNGSLGLNFGLGERCASTEVFLEWKKKHSKQIKVLHEDKVQPVQEVMQYSAWDDC